LVEEVGEKVGNVENIEGCGWRSVVRGSWAVARGPYPQDRLRIRSTKIYLLMAGFAVK